MPATKVHKLHKTQPRKRSTKYLCEAVTQCIEDHPDMSGYALIVWDKKGCRESAHYYSKDIPVRVLPEFAKQCLNARVNDNRE